MPTSGLLGLLGLPRLPRLEPLNPATQASYEEFTRACVDVPGSPDQLELPGQTLHYLRWLMIHRQVLFHGSQRDGLGELRTDRESDDSTSYGRQQAVFASDDAVWAMWFGLLTRGAGFRSTRNGSWTLRGDHNRYYFFSVDSDEPDSELLTNGWLYILPRDSFTREPALAGLLQSSQWTSPTPVRPLARLPITPADFPFTVCRHSPTDSMLHTLKTARRTFLAHSG